MGSICKQAHTVPAKKYWVDRKDTNQSIIPGSRFQNMNGDWGLGIGDWGLGPIPNPQSPIPKPQSPNTNRKNI